MIRVGGRREGREKVVVLVWSGKRSRSRSRSRSSNKKKSLISKCRKGTEKGKRRSRNSKRRKSD